jgi:cytochrome c oxidase subunit 2
VVAVTASRFSYAPKVINVKKGETVVLKLTSADKTHGICLSELNLRADIKPGEATELRFVPQKTGTIHFYCDVFCGPGHDDMNGVINVTD